MQVRTIPFSSTPIGLQRFCYSLLFVAVPRHGQIYHTYLLCAPLLVQKLFSLVHKRPESLGCVQVRREFFVDNLLVRIHFIIVMIRWTGLAPWEFEFHSPGSLTSTFLVQVRTIRFSSTPIGLQRFCYFLINFSSIALAPYWAHFCAKELFAGTPFVF